MDESNDETSPFSLLLFSAFAPIAQHHYSHICARRERRRRNAREDLQFHSELTGSTRRWNRLIKRKIFLHLSDAESTTKNMRRTWTKEIVRQKSKSDSRVKNSFSTFFISSPLPYPFLHSFFALCRIVLIFSVYGWHRRSAARKKFKIYVFSSSAKASFERDVMKRAENSMLVARNNKERQR